MNTVVDPTEVPLPIGLLSWMKKIKTDIHKKVNYINHVKANEQFKTFIARQSLVKGSQFTI